MKKFDIPPPAKLVAGLLYSQENHLEQIVCDLQAQYGEIDYRSSPLVFNYTDYYFAEMGKPLFRVFLGFTRLIDQSQLPEIKLFTNLREEEYKNRYQKRALNIDPGYLTATAFILATSKNYAHRIYLGKGIFAQQELLFERKRTVTLDWTYPDYRSVEYQEIFRRIRQIYLQQIAIQGTF